MTQKSLICADQKDKIRIICANLRVSAVSAFQIFILIGVQTLMAPASISLACLIFKYTRTFF